jgi:glycosyltransferase involved in cell wall biosynthesis
MNVLFWRTGFYGALTVGGVASLYKSLTNEFIKKGDNVHFASGGPMDLPEKANFHLIEYSRLYRNFPEVHNLPYNKKSSEEIIKIIDKFKIDFLYLHHHDFHYGLNILKKKLNIPVILHLDSIEYWVKKNWGKLYLGKLLQWCEQIEIEKADAILVISEELKNQLIDFYNVEPSKIFVSPNGVDVDKFSPKANKEQIINKYNLSESFVIGYSGVFNEYHGIDILLKSIKAILKEIPNAKFLLIGDGELRKMVDDFVRENSLSDKVIITGLVPFDEVPNYLATCDILVSPFKATHNTVFFNSPIKTFEYMAVQKPIVSTQIGQLSKILVDNHNSLIIEENDSDSLAEKVITLNNDKNISRIIAENARLEAVEKYSWSENYNRIIEIYTKIKK